MEFLYTILIFLLGSAIGSFLNVVVLRYNTGKITSGRSMCFSCGHKLSPLDLVPIASFLVQGGKCRYCGTKISKQYPGVEIITGILFVALFYKVLWVPILLGSVSIESFLLFILYAFIVSILVAIAVYDIRHKIIPNMLVYLFIILSALHLFLIYPLDYLLSYPGFFDLLAGLMFFGVLGGLWLISNGKWIGLGDGKLSLGIGLLLGFTFGISAIVLSFWIGAIFAILALILGKIKPLGSTKLTMKSEMPFAPFLILGTLIILFFPIDVIGISYFFEI
ncbi:MAG: hypothetical protein COV70_03895 [Parcubacteria group bacterium CG11_big_fil_rev_8_21_14_0_20_39_22]|nr:MAG: hypothetical protein COV70_03895 [Parcubacteria group bacterium CG11_big_fil_rev_8_21_14_0_20_39_22]